MGIAGIGGGGVPGFRLDRAPLQEKHRELLDAFEQRLQGAEAQLHFKEREVLCGARGWRVQG